VNSKKLKKKNKNWGIEESYFPFKITVAPLSKEDLSHSARLTPSQRIAWLIMMQKLLLKQFNKSK